MEELPEQSMPLVFRLFPKELAADAFAYMDGDSQELLIRAFTDKELDEVIGEMFLDDTVDLIEEMPANVVKRVLRHVDEGTRKMINQVLNYPKDSAGSIMTMEYIDLKGSMTVEQAFERIRKIGLDSETVYTCYVTDSRRKLEGVITVRELLLSPKDTVLRDIMETNVKFVSTHTDQEEAARQLSKYDFLALPVVDAEERLVGIVTVDDAMDVLQEEATEDMERMAAIAPSDKPYMKVSVFENWKKRAPWLLFLMISAAFTGSIITHFETALAANLVLSSFIPMLMSTGGNTGSQASTTIIRSLSLGEIRYRDIPRILLKESSTAVLCGVTLAVANFAKLMLLDQVGGAGGPGGLPDHPGGVPGGQPPGKPAAPGGQAGGPGPHRHGQPSHQHHLGRGEPCHLLQHRRGGLEHLTAPKGRKKARNREFRAFLAFLSTGGGLIQNPPQCPFRRTPGRPPSA